MYRGTGAIMWLGNAKFKQKGEQAEPDGVDGMAETDLTMVQKRKKRSKNSHSIISFSTSEGMSE